MAVRLSYPTRLPGPSTYQSWLAGSLGSEAGFEEGRLRYERMVLAVGYALDRLRVPSLGSEGLGVLERLPRVKGEERKRDAKEGWLVFCLRCVDRL